MRIECPGCSHAYDFPVELAPGELAVRCAACGLEFLVGRRGVRLPGARPTPTPVDPTAPPRHLDSGLFDLDALERTLTANLRRITAGAGPVAPEGESSAAVQLLAAVDRPRPRARPGATWSGPLPPLPRRPERQGAAIRPSTLPLVAPRPPSTVPAPSLPPPAESGPPQAWSPVGALPPVGSTPPPMAIRRTARTTPPPRRSAEGAPPRVAPPLSAAQIPTAPLPITAGPAAPPPIGASLGMDAAPEPARRPPTGPPAAVLAGFGARPVGQVGPPEAWDAGRPSAPAAPLREASPAEPGPPRTGRRARTVGLAALGAALAGGLAWWGLRPEPPPGGTQRPAVVAGEPAAEAPAPAEIAERPEPPEPPEPERPERAEATPPPEAPEEEPVEAGAVVQAAPRLEPEALQAAFAEALVAGRGQVLAVDCAERPCVLYGRVEDFADTVRLFAAPSLADYRGDRRFIYRWNTQEGEGPTQRRFAVALLPQDAPDEVVEGARASVLRRYRDARDGKAPWDEPPP